MKVKEFAKRLSEKYPKFVSNVDIADLLTWVEKNKINESQLDDLYKNIIYSYVPRASGKFPDLPYIIELFTNYANSNQNNAYIINLNKAENFWKTLTPEDIYSKAKKLTLRRAEFKDFTPPEKEFFYKYAIVADEVKMCEEQEVDKAAIKDHVLDMVDKIDQGDPVLSILEKLKKIKKNKIYSNIKKSEGIQETLRGHSNAKG